MKILDGGESGYIGIGLSDSRCALNGMPGWHRNGSCGYHGDDGYIFQKQCLGKEYGPKFTTNDIIGINIHIYLNKTVHILLKMMY